MRELRRALSWAGTRAARQPESGAPPVGFVPALHEHERERHRLLVEGAQLALPPQLPWLRDAIGANVDSGFVSVSRAAEQMQVDEDELLEMAARGLLEAIREGGALLVRPAIVSTLQVVDRRDDG